MLNVQLQYRRTENRGAQRLPEPRRHDDQHQRQRADFTERLARPLDSELHREPDARDRAVDQRVRRHRQRRRGDAGIKFPGAAATDPLNWGVPNLSFSGFTGLRSAAASLRTDDRLTTSYFWLHPIGQASAPDRRRLSGSTPRAPRATRTRAAAYIFTGLYSSGGSQTCGSQRRRLRRFPARRAAAGEHCRSAPSDASSPALLRRLRRRQLAEEREADLQPRASLRAGAALRRSQRPDGQSRRHARISPPRRPSSPAASGRTRAHFRRAC